MKPQSRPVVEPLEARALASSLAINLLTDRPTYRAGDVVYMKLTETNVSDGAVDVAWGPSNRGFSITHNGAIQWRSATGAVPLFLVDRTLAPGESITLKAHWRAPRGTGTYEIHSQMTPQGPIAHFRVMRG
jgi:hypothetical protein